MPIAGAQFSQRCGRYRDRCVVSDSATGQIHSIYPEGKSQPEFADLLLPKLGNINGLARKGRHLYVTSDQQLVKYHLSKKQVQAIELGASQLDGITLGVDDSAYVSSWETEPSRKSAASTKSRLLRLLLRI